MGTEFDIIIKNAVIIDGSGNPRINGDVGIKDGKISKLGRVTGSSGICIDGTGKIVSPGFVDPHNHADLFILQEPLTPLLARQGITTYASGNCGMSVAPGENNPYVNGLSRAFGFPLARGWKSFGQWLSRVETTGVCLNMIPFAGHNTLRSAVLGPSYTRFSTDSERRDLVRLVEAVMEEGAWGVSLGLDGGTPGYFADFSELLEVASATAKHSGILMPHTRHHQYNWASSINHEDTGYGIFYGPKSEAYFGRYHGHMEAIEIAEKSGVKLHIAHMSIPYLLHQPHPSWLDEELARAAIEDIIDTPRSRGVDVSFDVIPQIESIAAEQPIIDSFRIGNLSREDAADRIGSESFRREILEILGQGRLKFAWLHPLVDPYWFDCFKIISSKEEEFRGRILGEILRERNSRRMMDGVYELSFRILFDLLQRDPEATWAAVVDKRGLGMSTFLKHPFGMPCTDMVVQNSQTDTDSIYGMSPYVTNTFPDYLRRFVREEQTLTLEEGIHKATGLPAHYLFGLSDRGLVKEGYWADLIVFDYEKIAGAADFADPVKAPRGIEYVMVNGEIVVENGEPTGSRPGKILRRK